MTKNLLMNPILPNYYQFKYIHQIFDVNKT